MQSNANIQKKKTGQMMISTLCAGPGQIAIKISIDGVDLFNEAYPIDEIQSVQELRHRLAFFTNTALDALRSVGALKNDKLSVRPEFFNNANNLLKQCL